MDWYYASNGQQQGPVSREQLIELHRSGQVKDSDLVWNDSMTDWAPFGSVADLGGGAPAAEAPAAETPAAETPVAETPVAGVPAEEPVSTPPADTGVPASTGETSPALSAAPAAAVAAGVAGGEKVPTYLWQSIVCLVLCCLPLAIPAIIFATKVDPALKNGDIAAAKEASAKAKMWCWISFGVGLAVNIIAFFISFAASFAEASAGM